MVDYAKPQGDPNLPRAWSKHSKGSSAYSAIHGKEQGKRPGTISQAEQDAKNKEIEGKKDRFRQFLKVMGVAKENKQSWNDNFAAFMADEGSGLLHTSKVEDENKKKRKAKEEEKQKIAEEKDKKEVADDKELIDEQRLYVMNLPFTINHDELRALFQRFGDIEDTEIPLRRGGTGYGFAFIRFSTIEAAVSAFATLDKTYF